MKSCKLPRRWKDTTKKGAVENKSHKRARSAQIFKSLMGIGSDAENLHVYIWQSQNRIENRRRVLTEDIWVYPYKNGRIIWLLFGSQIFRLKRYDAVTLQINSYYLNVLCVNFFGIWCSSVRITTCWTVERSHQARKSIFWPSCTWYRVQNSWRMPNKYFVWWPYYYSLHK